MSDLIGKLRDSDGRHTTEEADLRAQLDAFSANRAETTSRMAVLEDKQ